MNEEERRRLFGFRQPRKNGEENNFDYLGAAGTVAKYGVPLAVILSTNARAKKLREDANVDLEEPELMVGRVRGLRRPNFGLRRRDPAGSSLAEYVAGQKYGDAFQRDQEINFEIADEQTRIGQENEVLNRTNQSVLAKNQVRNQEKLIRGNVSAQELLSNTLPFKQEAILGLYHNFQSDITQAGYVDALYDRMRTQERSQNAATVLTNPMSSEEDRKAARDYIMKGFDTIPEKKKGGKLRAKTKFYGRTSY
jgi:hypothetical protein